MTTATINGRQYNIHTEERFENERIVGYRISGVRKADGALLIHKNADKGNRALVVGVAALERLNWWDINTALAGVLPELPA
jgi:hypothetical protein